MSSYLVVIYGTSSANKDVGRQLARTLPGASAVLSVDAFVDGAIVQPSDDATAELDMAHTQVRLLVANYMRNGYHVVVEGAFYYRRDGRLHRYEQDIDQLVALMRNMTRKALTVRLGPPAAGDGIEYRPRYGANAMTIDDPGSAEDVAEAIRLKLLAEEFT